MLRGDRADEKGKESRKSELPKVHKYFVFLEGL